MWAQRRERVRFEQKHHIVVQAIVELKKCDVKACINIT
jgi:hypothetical protein